MIESFKVEAKRLWAMLAAENIPRLFLWFLFFWFGGALAVYWLERHSQAVHVTPTIDNFQDAWWWAIVTLSTVGYGDKVPVTLGGRLIGVFEIVVGVATVGLFTGKLASVLVEQRIKEGRGLKDLDQMRGHFVICGWKPDMPQILEDILVVNEGLRPSRVVMVNNADEADVDALRSDRRFKDIRFVRGDFEDANVLRRAGVHHAAKVMVLADAATTQSDKEIDARTVMTMMTIRSMTKTIYSCAEIIDRKFKEHLKLAGCDEIILSREYSRFMLVNASSSAGIASVLHELLNVRAQNQLRTTAIPDQFIGKTFGELTEFYHSQENAVLIGLLENTGNPLLLKRQALREAQKTPDVSKLVNNLKQVKQIEANMPTINPPDDYVLHAHALAIVVG
ncbi:MAG: potassium channel family protein [Candidatus Xenobia bacterium]